MVIKMSKGTRSALGMLRVKRGMSQAQAAAAIGVSYVTLSKWENGRAKPSADSLIKLARAYACTVDDLLN